MLDGGFGFEREASLRDCRHLRGVRVPRVAAWRMDRGPLARPQARDLVRRRFHCPGHLSIALSQFLRIAAFFLGLILIVIGTGLLKPNISAIVGDLYPEGGSRRDAGFSIFYMGINVGALIAPLVTGYLGEQVGWHWGFGAAGVGMLLGLITFRMRADDTLGPLGCRAVIRVNGQTRTRSGRYALIGILVVAAIVAMAMFGVFTIDPVAVAKHMRNVMLGLAVVYFAYLFLVGRAER